VAGAEAYLHAKFHVDPSKPFGHSTPTSQTDRTDRQNRQTGRQAGRQTGYDNGLIAYRANRFTN